MQIKFLDSIIHTLDTSLIEDISNSISQDIIFHTGHNKKIDEYSEILHASHNWISQYQKKLSQEYNISNLKIKFTNNSGYFIEISGSQISKIPESFLFKQSLTQVSRYITSELQEYQEKILEANQNIELLQKNIFSDICNDLIKQISQFSDISKWITQIDFFSNAAFISSYYNYTTPQIFDSNIFEVIEWKHPIISPIQKDFVSNNLKLSHNDRIHVITWPNMGWKSTFLRQNALIALMSHIWFDVPARQVHIWVVDIIFSRVGAGDNLYLGQSTFMVEMQEISYILHHATKKSFIIIDEIGRGTSTYDGMSLAWSILKYITIQSQSRGLFATHYHEIIDHVSELVGVSNYSVAVSENEENIVFLRKIIPWGIKKSYWLEVARLSWIPTEIIVQAKSFMKQFDEKQNFQQLSLMQVVEEKTSWDVEAFIQEVSLIDINSISPLEALYTLIRFQEQVKKMK